MAKPKMEPEIKVNDVLEGRITEVRDYGAFVELDGNRLGLVHISEIDDGYVKDIYSVVRPNQKVKVKVLEIKEDGRIELSMKQAKNEELTREPVTEESVFELDDWDPLAEPPEIDFDKEFGFEKPETFEQMLKQFKKQSSENLLSIRRSNDAKLGGKKRK